MRVLAIGEAERLAIRDALARAPTIDRATIERFGLGGGVDHLAIADRPPEFARPQSAQVIIPQGYRCAVTFEDQPCGRVLHLSVSVVGEPGAMPHPLAVEMIAEEFGCVAIAKVYTEEYEPGEFAVNVLSVEPQGAA